MIGGALLLACAPTASSSGTIDLPGSLNGTEWWLDSLYGMPVPPRLVSMEIADSGIGGYSGCNWYGARYRSPSAPSRFTPVEATARGCGASTTMEREVRYHAALARIAGVAQRDDVLRMSDSSGAVLLAFRKRTPANVDPAMLERTAWELVSGGDAAPPTLRIGRDSLSGCAGQRRFIGTYGARGDRIHVSSLTMLETVCGRGPGARRREEEFISRLSESAYYRIDRDLLELVTVNGDTMPFRR